MPIYEYQCQSCGEHREVLQRLSDPPLETCDECGGEVRKLVSAPAFQFKGSGWYVTDYARKGEGDGESKAEKTGDSGDAGDAGAGESTEAKPADSKSSESSKTESSSGKAATASA